MLYALYADLCTETKVKIIVGKYPSHKLETKWG